MVKEIKDNEYKTVIKEGKVIIDCYAPWCGPCKMISPVLDKISEELKEKEIKFYKINVDTAEQIVTDFQIMSIPTILIFENGSLKDKIVGLRSKTELIEIINK